MDHQNFMQGDQGGLAGTMTQSRDSHRSP